MVRASLLPLALLISAAACSTADSSAGGDDKDASSADATAPVDAGVDAPPLPAEDNSCAGPCPGSNIKHLIVLVQENHTFDDHFGGYCQAAAGSNPTCTSGPSCCEAMPAMDPAGTPPTVLTDLVMEGYDPDHGSSCETAEMDNGKMDLYATASGCGSPQNIVIADPTVIKPYWDIASQGALADRYFQPIIGASSSNDMYFARAQFVFEDNDDGPKGAIGMTCDIEGTAVQFPDTTIGDLLDTASVPWSTFYDGYTAMSTAVAAGGCPTKPPDCAFPLPVYPCVFDPSDVPFEYYASSKDVPTKMQDITAFEGALANGGLPAVTFVRAVGYRSEHPGHGDKLSDGVAFAANVVQEVAQSRYRGSSLVLLTFDEGGGYFDHITPPPTSAIDNKPYGTRVPLVATGPFAKTGEVSHVTMEHSSIVKFIEWNWLGGTTGQLKGRDTVVANIGSLLDSTATGTPVPVQ